MLARIKNPQDLARHLERDLITELHEEGVPVQIQLNAFRFVYRPEVGMLERRANLPEAADLPDHVEMGCSLVALLVHYAYQEKKGLTDDERSAILRDAHWYATHYALSSVYETEQDLRQRLEKYRRKAQAQAKHAAQKRWSGREVEKELRNRGLLCALNEDPHLTAAELRDWLEGNCRTYDNEDVELSLSGDDVLVRDLATSRSVRIPKDQLSTYMNRARGRS